MRFKGDLGSQALQAIEKSDKSSSLKPLYFETFLAINQGKVTQAKSLIASGQQRWTPEEKGHLLREAVRCCRTELTGLLLKSGADTKVVDQDGRTALHQAASKGSVEIVAMLIKAGADPKAKIESFGVTPLHITN